MHRVIIVDDQPLFRGIIRALLENAGGFEIVGETSDGEEAVGLYSCVNPDLVMMDVQMERVNGFEATARIVAHDPSAAVIITSMKQDPEYVRLAGEAGAIGFFSKRTLDAENVRELLEGFRERGARAA